MRCLSVSVLLLLAAALAGAQETPTDVAAEQETQSPDDAVEPAAEPPTEPPAAGDEMDHAEDDDWSFRAENGTELPTNATEPAGNFTTTELPGNATAPAGNSSDATLSCFVCSAAMEPVCDDPFNAAAAEAAGLLQECPSAPGVSTVCRKTWEMVPGDTRVVRDCAHDNDVRTCFVTAEAVSASHVCHCHEDACNGAPAVAGAAAAGMLLLTAAVRALG